MLLFQTILISFLLQIISTSSHNNTTPNRTKTKRTLPDQIYSNGDGRAVVFYMESPQTSDVPELQASASSPGIRNFYSAPSKPLALVSVQQPIQVFEQDSPKQVAAQQVLYEFQQTPTNAESNVHVKQLFQPNVELTTRVPFSQNQQIEQLQSSQPLSTFHQSSSALGQNQQFLSPHPHANGLTSASNHPATSESIVSPVQHNVYTNHALNSASFNLYNPLLPPSQQFQNTQIMPNKVPGKYIYLNGKIVYHPNHLGRGQQGQAFPPNSLYNRGIYHNQQKLPLINYGVKHNRPNPQNSPVHGNPVGRTYNNGLNQGHLPPITQNRFQAPKQVQQIDKPSSPPQQSEESEEAEKHENEENNESNDDEEEGDERESDHEENDFEEDDDSFGYETFPFEEEEYVDESESYQPRSAKQRKNKDKNRNNEEEIDDDHDDDRSDTKRGSSKQNARYNNPNRSRNYRTPPKYDSSENYGYREKYSSNMKYKSPSYKHNGKREKPQGQFKKVQYSKKPGSKPKIKKIEGRFSENIPVTHKQKVYKERWFVSQDLEGSKKNKKSIK